MGGPNRSIDAQILTYPNARIASELFFHDRQARERAQTFRRDPEKLRFSDDAYVNHETWIVPAIQKLGDVRGLDVMDYGCGHGMAAVVFARAGARVTAFDLSGGYITEARARARANGADVTFLQADAEYLPFADHSFDRIWGNAILHHLDIHRAAQEIRRVLRPGGIAVFSEPWGGNRLLSWARSRWRYQAKHRTMDERPLTEPNVQQLKTIFPALQVEGCQLLSMVRRVMNNGRFTSVLARIDHFLLGRLPSLQRYCRYIIVTLKR
jgi:SAM-dependent methyltransferase